MSPCSTTHRSQYLSSVLVEVMLLPAGGLGGKVVQSIQRIWRGERSSYSSSDGQEAHIRSGLYGSVENEWMTTFRSFTSRNSILQADLQKDNVGLDFTVFFSDRSFKLFLFHCCKGPPPPPNGTIFFHFHAVLFINWSNNRLAPLFEVDALGNSGSATANVLVMASFFGQAIFFTTSDCKSKINNK